MAEFSGRLVQPAVEVVRPKSVVGQRLRFRSVTVSDAEFILRLRLDDRKNQHLSQVDADLAKQREWLARYSADKTQTYFIIETLAGKAVGTIRLYDPRGTSFCWGSWILTDAAPQGSGAESLVMIYSYGLSLGFDASHFDVRRENIKVWQYHERLGAKRVGETNVDFFYTIDRERINAIIERYRSRMPDGVKVIF